MLRYKIDIIKSLKDAGYNPSRIKREGLIGEMTMYKIRHGSVILSYQTIDAICRLLQIQPGDILEYIPDEPEQPKEPSEPDDIF